MSDYFLDINLNNNVNVIALNFVTIFMSSYSPIKSSQSLLVRSTGRVTMITMESQHGTVSVTHINPWTQHGYKIAGRVMTKSRQGPEHHP